MAEWWRRSLADWKDRFQNDFELVLDDLEGVRLCFHQAPTCGKVNSENTKNEEATRSNGAKKRKSLNGGVANSKPQSKDDPSDTGCTLWDASLVLTHWLVKDPSLVKGKRVLELGAGIGVSGMVASKLGAKHVVLTDLPIVVPLLESNVELNECQANVSVMPLEWGNEEHIHGVKRHFSDIGPQGKDLQEEKVKLDVILCADLVYLDKTVFPLIKTLRSLGSPETLILFCQDCHRPEPLAVFYENIAKYADLKDVPRDQLHPDYTSDEIRTLIVKVKKV